MCMKAPYMFMTLLIPGPNDPTKDFHVYLRPLIDELKFLWHTGVETYDRASPSNFMMRVALMWTINDFPALGMISGWSIMGKLACPLCIREVKAKQLKYGGKSTMAQLVMFGKKMIRLEGAQILEDVINIQP